MSAFFCFVPRFDSGMERATFQPFCYEQNGQNALNKIQDGGGRHERGKSLPQKDEWLEGYNEERKVEEEKRRKTQEQRHQEILAVLNNNGGRSENLENMIPLTIECLATYHFLF